MPYPNLAAEMTRQGLTVNDIAEVAGCSPDTIRNWMKGKGDFPIRKAFLIQAALFPGCEVTYLFGSEPIIRTDGNQKAVG